MDNSQVGASIPSRSPSPQIPTPKSTKSSKYKSHTQSKEGIWPGGSKGSHKKKASAKPKKKKLKKSYISKKTRKWEQKWIMKKVLGGYKIKVRAWVSTLESFRTFRDVCVGYLSCDLRIGGHQRGNFAIVFSRRQAGNGDGEGSSYHRTLGCESTCEFTVRRHSLASGRAVISDSSIIP
eukprot:922126-Amorphochlora_amoeboformis.AAC.2